MSNIKQLSGAIRFALFAGAATLLAAPAMAQAQTPATGEETQTLDRIEVTGSRIKRTDRETAQPVLVLTRERLQVSGLTSVGDVLQRLAEVGPALTTGTNNGGDGSSNVNLRNLGAARTLVLVNGRRWVTGLNGTVDLNTIPTAMIESIEVLKDGASSIYGSDAIGGVINVILVRDFDGARANTFWGQNSEGDGGRMSADFTIGSSSERGNTTLSAGYVKEEPVFAGDRAISAVPNYGLPAGLTGSGSTPLGQYIVTGTPGTVTNRQGQAPGPNTTAQFRRWNQATDAYNFAPDNYLITPQERASIFGTTRYDITERLTFNAHAMYNNRRSSQKLAPMPVGFGPTFGAGLASTIRVSAINPFNPFGVEVPSGSRRFTEGGDRTFIQDVTTFRFGGGFTGNFDFADRTFDWDVGYSFTENENVQQTLGLFNLGRIRNALTAFDADPGAGFDPRCGTPGANPAAPLTGASLIAGCVPLNILGGLGSITPAMINYITFNAKDIFRSETKNYFANITGSLFELPAGEVGFAAGYEHRSEFGEDNPDAIIAAGETTGNARTATRGGYTVEEFYAEALVPILSDVTFAELLELRLAGRYSDFSTFGETTTWSSGFQWRPFGDLLVRGNYNKGFRAPTVQDLFRGRSDSFPQLSDPCSAGPFGSLSVQSAATRANCFTAFPGSAGAVPAGYAQANSQIRITLGGEPSLTPEESISQTIGFVYSPSQIEGLGIAVDYWDIEITNRIIASRGAGVLLTQCYRDQNAQACSRITRQAGTGIITDLLATNENAGTSNATGIDLSVSYDLPEFGFGNFGLNWDSSYYIKDDRTNLAYNRQNPFSYWTNNPVTQFVGYGGFTPRLRSNMALSWSQGDLSATWTARYIAGGKTACATAYRNNAPQLCSDPNQLTQAFQRVPNGPLVNQLLPQDDFGATTYHDFTVAYALPWNGTVRAGVNNAFDRQPPQFVDGTTNSYDSNTYDVPGRAFFVSYSQNF